MIHPVYVELTLMCKYVYRLCTRSVISNRTGVLCVLQHVRHYLLYYVPILLVAKRNEMLPVKLSNNKPVPFAGCAHDR